MDFMDGLMNELNNAKTFTENGAVAYATSGQNILDFNFSLTSLRKGSFNAIENAFSRVYFDDPKTAIKYLFYAADVREGLGERKIFRSCMSWLAKNKPEVATAVLGLIPEYTRWDNLIVLINEPAIADEVLAIVKNQLTSDINSMKSDKPISLLAKWMPSENTSSAETRALAKTLRSKLNMSSKHYRQTLSALRNYSNVIECKMSANNWSEIEYESVPSLANTKYKDAFFKHDKDRRTAYLTSLKKGETTINASVLQPSDIVSKYYGEYYWNYWKLQEYDETLEQLWKSLPDFDTGNSLVVRDGSGSMICSINNGKMTALDVATSLAIYMAEHANGQWNNKFITFSRKPKFINLSGTSSLRDKLLVASRENDCSNTDIYATMKLILDTAVNNKMKQEDMPDNIIIVSDMQFDSRYGWFNWDESLFDSISKEYNKYGYKLPRIIFWNLDAFRRTAIPMQKNELGLVLCSGYSVQTLNMVMSNNLDPLSVLLEQINKPRYDAVEKAIENYL